MSKSDFPEFYVVGTAKAGTTTIWSNLKQHPDVFLVNDVKFKELGFFASDHGVKSKEDYLKFFKEAKPNQIAGEVCNSYLADLSCAQEIYNAAPNAKIIICLRDPISRAASLHRWMVQSGYEEVTDFEAALKEEEKRMKSEDFCQNNPHGNYRNYLYKRSGLYYEQVKTYLTVFGKEQCLLLKFEDLKTAPDQFMKTICNFLGISDDFKFETKISNASKELRFKGLQKFLRITLPKWRNKLGLPKGMLSKPVNWLIKKNIKKSSTKKHMILEKTSAELNAFFKTDLQKLEELTGLELNSWYSKSFPKDS